MDLRRLRTIVAVAEHTSFTAAGDALGLSHSAVSLHVRELELELGAALVDRNRRPAALTARGAALVEHARRMLAIAEEIAALGRGPAVAGTLSIGVVPSAVAWLAAPALAALKAAHPRLQMRLRAGLSAELALMVRAGELDAALTTAPPALPPGLGAAEVAREPLLAIAPPDAASDAASDAATGGTTGAGTGGAAALLAGRPFVWFNRRAWAGQVIETRLAAMGLTVQGAMEVDSLEAVAALVRHGLGASVAPRGGGGALAGLRTAPLGPPPAERVLVLIEPERHARAQLCAALRQALSAAAR